MRTTLTTALLCTATMLLPCAHAQHSDTVTNQFTGLAETPASSPDKELGVEVLSVSVSKLARDSFGNPMNPFNSFHLNEADPGTVLLAKITPRGAAPWELQPDRCRVVSFTDDVGTDLSTNAAPKSEDHFFPRNRPLDMLTAREQGRYFGVRIRSSRVPAPTANRLIADVSLLFRIGSEERSRWPGAAPPRRAGGLWLAGPAGRGIAPRSQTAAGMLPRRASPASQIPFSKTGIHFCTDPKFSQTHDPGS